MSLLAGNTPPPRDEHDETSVDLALVVKVGAVLGGIWLALVGLFLGVRKFVGPPPPPEEPQATEPAKPPPEKLGMKPQGHVPAEGAKSAHEGADLHPEKVVGVAAILAIVIALSVLTILLLFHLFEHEYPGRTSEANPLVTAAQIPPAPGVVPDPDKELREVRYRENLHLEQYGWVDGSHTAARIPIERAMALWVQTYTAPAPEVAPNPMAGGISLVAPANAASTNAAPTGTAAARTSATQAPVAPGVTELQMRQQKATEGSHAP